MNHSLYLITLSLFILTTFGCLIQTRWLRGFNYYANLTFALSVIPLTLYVFAQYHDNTLSPSLLICLVTAMLTLLCLVAFKLHALVSISAPFIVFILILQPFTSTGVLEYSANRSSHKALLLTHISLAVVGQSLAILAAFVSLLYILQYRNLKQRRFSRIFNNVPGLDKLATANKLTLYYGFVILSLALLTGVIYAQFYWSAQQNALLPKIIWATFVWAWYLGCLWLNQLMKAKPLTLAKMCLVGFVILALGYFGYWTAPNMWIQ